MFLYLDKPKGISSFKFLGEIKKKYPGQKVGHAGTLDPMATGLMIVAVGRESTKQLSNFVGLDKRYDATIDLSLYTDTRDDEHWEERRNLIIKGDDQMVELFAHEAGVNFRFIPSLKEIVSILEKLIGEVELPIPPFSAKKVAGKKLYDLARKGENLHRVGMMKIFEYTIVDYNFPLLTIKIHVGSGTYVRSIGRWIGMQLGLGGSVTVLRRTQIGDIIL